MHQQDIHKLWAFFKRQVNGLYLVAIAFIVVGVILSQLPTLKGTIWQSIGVALIGAGFTIFVTTITAQRSVFEQYKKDANLDRKRDVYRPLHAQLRELREVFDEAHAGRQPYPVWIKIEGDNFQPSLYMSAYVPPTFFYWPSFKKNSDVDDDFSHGTQKLLDDVQSHIKAYNEAAQTARKVTREKLTKHLESSFQQMERSREYQEWQKARNQPPPSIRNERFEFMHSILSSSSGRPLGDNLNQEWARKFGWLLAGKVDQAAKEIYDTDLRNMVPGVNVPLSSFIDLFQPTLDDLKNDPAYKDAMDAQDRLFKRLQDAEEKLKDGMIEIRNRYQGGPPPV
jgi:hypothetical protein